MRRAFAASFGFALALVLVGCGEGAQPAADKGEIYVQVRGELSSYISMEVSLTPNAGGSSVTVALTKDGNTFVGSQTGLEPGTWTGQLRGRDFFWETIGDPIQIEIQAGTTTEAIFVVPKDDSSSSGNPKISSVVVSNSKVPTYDSISVEVTLAAAGTYTVTGSAPAAAGSFGAATGTGTGPYTLDFTAGGTPGFYDLTVTATQGDDSDSVTFQVEVIDGAGPGTVQILATSSPAPTVEIESEKVVTGPSTVMDFAITATANGQGAGEDLGWSFRSENTGPVGGNCDQAIWTVNGVDSTGTASGTMASGSSLSAHLHINSVDAPGGRIDCSVSLVFTDAAGSSYGRHYTVKRAAPTVTFTE